MAQRAFLAFILAGLFVAAVIMFEVSRCRVVRETKVSQNIIPSIRQGRIGTTAVLFEIADTPQKRRRGLSGRRALGDGEAMLFDFGVAEHSPMWMKDMNFPLDFLWVGDDLQITEVTEKVLLETWPQTFTSRATGRYVIEVKAGWVERHGVQVGDTVSW